MSETERDQHETGAAPDGEPRLVNGEPAELDPAPGEPLLDQAGVDALLGQLGLGGGASAPPVSADRPGPSGAAFDLPEIQMPASGAAPGGVDQLELLKDVHVKVRVELGRGAMYLRDILRLTNGSVVELEKLAGDPLDIYVNDRLIAKGEVLVLNENFCIRVTEIFTPREVLRLTG